MTKRALHEGQVIFFQPNPNPWRLNCSMSTGLVFSDVGAGLQDPDSDNIKIKAQVISQKDGTSVGSLIALVGVLQ